MKQKLYLVLILAIISTMALVVTAQDISPTEVPTGDEDIAISYPPPV